MLSNQKKNYLIVISIGVVISLAFLYLSLQNSFGTEESLHKASTEHLYGVPRFNGYPHGGIDDNRTAFVFGATGIYATSELFKCMSAIESLTKIGGWKGAVYLLMDKDTCLNRKLLKSFNNKNIRIVPVMKERRRQRRSRRKLLRTVTGHNLTDFVAINNTLNGRRLMNTQPFERSMAVKMHILDYLPSHIEYAVWYDCDVLFIRPNCVEQMMTNKPEITKERPIFLSLPGHVGSFVVKTDVSRDALDQWHTQILASNSPSALGDRPAIPDYKVFINLFGDNVTDPSSKFGLLHSVWKDSMPKGFTANHSVTWDTTECVVHLSNGRCRHLGPNNIDEFVKNLHLRSYGDRKWCPSVVRRKFKTYGIEWPFCWNPPLFWDA